jgi:AraC-like DNA-binding protein
LLQYSIFGPGLALGLFALGAMLLLQARTPRTLATMPERLYCYDDGNSAGRSRVQECRPIPGGWRLVYSLQADASGYCGLGFAFGKDVGSFRDLSRLDDFEFRLVNSASRTVKLIARSNDPKLTRLSEPFSSRYSEARLDPRPEGELKVQAKSFAIATWWLDMGYVPVTDTIKRFDRLHSLEFQVVGSGQPSRFDTLDILAPQLWLASPMPWKVVLSLWSAGLVWLGIWLLRMRRIRTPVPAPSAMMTESVVESLQVESVPQPVPTAMRSESELQRERLVEWLRAHYSESELDADAVAKGCGIPRDRLATLLKEGYGMAFKPFLNELRLTEAARLLRETDRSISEIAFAVGYNSHTHFTRVFRERYQMTPGEWRESSEPLRSDDGASG